MKSVKYHTYSILFSVISLSIVFISCKKEKSSNDPENDVFLKVYAQEGDQTFSYVKITKDGFFMLGVHKDSLFVIRADKQGQMISRKTVQGTTFGYPLVTVEKTLKLTPWFRCKVTP